MWRANVTSRVRALLMLFLFSDVGETDAPTASRSGRIATSRDVSNRRGKRPVACDAGPIRRGLQRPEALVTGEAATPISAIRSWCMRADASWRSSALHGATAASSC